MKTNGQSNEIDPMLAELNLDSVGNNRFIGHIERVPFRMEMVANNQTLGLLFHTRFAKLKQPIPEFPDVPDGGQLQALIEEKKADYTAEQDQAWFNLFAAHELIDRGELLPVLREFAASLKSYVDFDDQPCFACKETKSTQPIYHCEKLHLVCDGCYGRLNEKAAALTKIGPANALFSLFWAAIMSVVGAVIWAVGWTVFEWIFVGLRLPTIVFTIAFLAIAGVVAIPIAWVFKKTPKRGVRFGNVILSLACLLTAILGEAFLCVFFVYREIHIVPDAAQTVEIWRSSMAEAGSFYVIGKLITVGIIWAILKENSSSKISLEEAAAPPAR